MNWRDEFRTLVEERTSEELPELAGELARASAVTTLRLNSRENAAKPAPADRLLKAQEVAELLGVSDKWVYRYATKLGAIQLSEGAVRFPERSLHRYIFCHGKA